MAQDVRPINPDNHGLSTPTNNTTPTVQPLVSAESRADDVSSLRAKALLTRRPKRRKDSIFTAPAPSNSLPLRPIAHDSNSFLLDYGSEPTEERDVKPTLPLVAEIGDRPMPQFTAETEIKEEGEISDEEPRASSIASSSSPVDGVRHPDHKSNVSALAQAAATSRVRIKSDPEISPAISSNGRHPMQSATNQVHDIWNGWVPSDDHVRPGLKMNMDQFNLVKELILDLLGWGVSPEYLVDCGLTREAVFHTFMELNLKLPQNLDVSGLLPSPPRDDITSNIDHRSTRVSENNRDNTSPLSLSQSEALPLHVRKASLSHPLPPKPQGPPPSTSPTASTTIMQRIQQSGQNLSDMEAQKRQELQARKAVLASRRKKAVQSLPAEASTPSTSTTTPTAVLDGLIVDEPEPVVPATAIDDFLKSMMETTATPSHPSTSPLIPKARTLSGGVPLGVASPVNTLASAVSRSPVTSLFPLNASVDVDSTGLESFQVAPASISGETVGSGDLRILPRHTIAPQVSTQSSSDSTPSAVSLHERKDTFASSALTQTSNSRRGTKRPVAMDFVDVEHHPTSVQGSTSMPAPPPFVRRKMGGFAGLGGHKHRKCVIDLSDSEDDDCDETADEKRIPRSDEISTSSKSNTPRTALTPGTRPPTTRPSSTAGIVPSKSASPGLSPEALEEKEKQIKQMREAIARREQERLRKLVEKSRTPVVTPPPPSSSSSTSALARTEPSTSMFYANAEEFGTQLPASTSSESVGRPSRSESSSFSDRADEDIVMQTLEPTSSTSTIESTLSTPTDIKSNVLEHSITGELVLTVEAQEEFGARQSIFEDRDSDVPVDVAGPGTSSAEVGASYKSTLYSTYNSPFYYYPLLRSRPQLVVDTAPETLVLYSSSLLPSSPGCFKTVVTIPDLRPLRMTVMYRLAGNDMDRRVCQYEVPGGGMCRDETCTDLHLGEMEPDDHETARYLREVMPDILQTFTEADIADQLVQTRQNQSGLMRTSSQPGGADSLEDRVVDTITALVSGR